MAAVSVCIPTYNRSGLLVETIESVLAQDFGDYECLVLDNDSQDDTALMVSQYEARGVKYLRNTSNVGMVANWNRCIEAASGKYIAVIHDDDVIMEDMLRSSVHALESLPRAGMAFSGVETIDIIGKSTGYRRAFNHAAELQPGEAFMKLLEFNVVPPPTVMVPRAVYEEVGTFDERAGTAADWDMWLRISRRYSVLFLDKILAQYRVSQLSGLRNAESDGSLARDLRYTLEKALASNPGQWQPPARTVRRGKSWVAGCELVAALALLARGENHKYREHTLAALRYAPGRALSREGAIALSFLPFSLFGGVPLEWLRASRGRLFPRRHQRTEAP